MPYNYEDEKPKLFTEQNQEHFIHIRDKVLALLDKSGAIMMDNIMDGGDTWLSLAFIDRMVEIGDLREVERPGCAGQHRVFVRPGT